MEVRDLPVVNACLNTLSTLFLLAGFISIKSKRADWHKKFMGSATLTSVLFLGCYLYYHFHHGSTKFQGEGFIRAVYFTILISHTILAASIAYLVPTTLFYALQNELKKHAKLARVTFPIWLYVSVTGVVIYWMLYQ